MAKGSKSVMSSSSSESHDEQQPDENDYRAFVDAFSEVKEKIEEALKTCSTYILILVLEMMIQLQTHLLNLALTPFNSRLG